MVNEDYQKGLADLLDKLETEARLMRSICEDVIKLNDITLKMIEGLEETIVEVSNG